MQRKTRLWVFAVTLFVATHFLAGQELSSAQNESSALMKSLILPGWGQYSLGDPGTARWLITAEAGLWLGYLLAHGATGWYQQDYRAFAALHAGTSYRLKPDIYYYRLGQYHSISEYNQEQLRDRNLAAVYPTDADLAWEWDDMVNRERYNHLRYSSLRAAKVASFAIGGMVVNRAFAVIHVLFLSRKKGMASARLIPLPHGGEIRFNLQL